MLEFLKQYGILILALIGIIQVWVITLWKKYIMKAKIEIYETGPIEIGYSLFGPTVGLNGTLRALNKDVFIRSIELIIVREKDKSQHVFNWIAFRPPKIDLSGRQSISMEIPSGFLISLNSPHRYNIAFNDNNLFEEMRPLISDYTLEWNKVVAQLSAILSPSVGATPPDEIKAQQIELIENFRKSNIRVNTGRSLDRKCYWEPGNYSLTLSVRTSNPDRVFSKNYHFFIDEANSENLKLNVITMLEEPISHYLGIQNFPYNIAYSSYK